MTKKFKFLLLGLILVLAVSGQTVLAQSDDSEYFPETGHFLTGDFYDFYFANPNARLVYGLPITEAFIDQQSGLLIQYFEKVRLEYHPEDPPGEKIKLTPLGKKTYEPGVIIEGLTTSTPNCHQQKGWNFPVCFSFYRFYDHFGGELQFGKPVSGLEYLHGRLVQYFENVKLVWMPENPDQARIVIAPLGYEYFYAVETDFSLLEPFKNYEYNLNISEIRVRAFPKHAVLPNGSTQEIDIIAVDQNNAPLTNGIVQVTVRYPDQDQGDTTTESLATDEFGLANIAINTNSTQPGVVEVIVKVTYNDLEGISITSFRIWY